MSLYRCFIYFGGYTGSCVDVCGEVDTSIDGLDKFKYTNIYQSQGGKKKGKRSFFITI
jgi:hypothetical protein